MVVPGRMTANGVWALESVSARLRGGRGQDEKGLGLGRYQCCTHAACWDSFIGALPLSPKADIGGPYCRVPMVVDFGVDLSRRTSQSAVH